MGGRECVVDIDESSFQEKRKYIKSRLVRADQKPAKHIED